MVLGVLCAAAGASVAWRWSLLAYGLPGLVVLWQLHRLLDRLWWRPRRLERELRAQGIRGTSYRFLAGDLTRKARLNKEAWSRPLPLRCHDIGPRVAPFLSDSVREHGKVSLSWFGPIPKVTITDPDLAKLVLSNKFGHLEKPKFPALWKLLANGLSNHEGDKWMESIGSNGSCELDVWPEIQSLTGDVISRTAFGSSYLEGRKIFQLQSEQAGRIMTNIRTILIPGYLSLPTTNNRRMYQINDEIESILRGLIEKRIKAMKEGQSAKQDLLGLLLEPNIGETYENGQSNIGMTIEDVIEECKLFYFAGMETTSVLVTWTMIVLSMHPEWQDRARQEVLGLFGKNKPEYEGLNRLKMVTMILYEVLRLYPSSIHLSRKTYKEVQIGDTKYPAGVMIELAVLFMHHDPDIWGTDVHEFKPERFADGISKASKNPGAFLPFGWGPRICIGQNFALLEAKMAICMILQRFEFVLAPSYTHAPHTVVTLHPMHGAQIKLGLI
ncbi:hypothetical protein ACQ4PT_068692 [Festuca glaucescens]